MPLSLSNKNTIKEALAPFIKSPSDIYWLEDLNRLLGDSPKIEEKYFKLWIKSTTVLKKMLNNGIDSRSKAYISQIIAKAHKLTQTQDYFNLVEQLEMKKILILTWDPWVWKTTLAGILLLFFIYKGYDFYLIDESIHEIESIYDSTRKQIFYFDDFLGSNYLEAIDGDRKNSQINNFIDRVKSDSNQIFILSSRINIIQQAYSRSKYLQREKIW